MNASDGERRRDIRRGFIAGAVATIPWLVATFALAAHWNAYYVVSLFLGGAVIVWTGIAVTLDRYQGRGR